MPDNRLTAGQRKAQAFQVSQNIDKEARKIATETGCGLVEALEKVFRNAELLERCHQAAPAETFPAGWAEPK